MKIAIMCSLAFANEVGKIKTRLEAAGHEVSIPYTIQDILDGKTTIDEIESMKGHESFVQRVKEKDLIRVNWERMKKDDAILVINLPKKGIDGYIGANTFLEIGFAHVLNKKIFIWHDLPTTEFYEDELLSMSPVIIKENINLIH